LGWDIRIFLLLFMLFFRISDGTHVFIR
jgi:hypothetical protein